MSTLNIHKLALKAGAQRGCAMHFRYSDYNPLNIPRPRTASVQRSFAHAVPRVWNSFPHAITEDNDNLNICALVFESRLKTFLYTSSDQ